MGVFEMLEMCRDDLRRQGIEGTGSVYCMPLFEQPKRHACPPPPT